MWKHKNLDNEAQLFNIRIAYVQQRNIPFIILDCKVVVSHAFHDHLFFIQHKF